MARIKLFVITAVAVLVVMGLIVSDTFTAETATDSDLPDEVSMGDPAYIKFAGIDGESQDKDHKDWCDILSFQQGITKPGGPGATTGPTRRRGDVQFEDIVITKELDKASPKLAESLCKGSVFPLVMIELSQSYPDAGRVTYYAYELKNVQLTSYMVTNEGTLDGYPFETMTINFEEIKVTYTEIDDMGKKKGTIEYSWKVEEGKAP